MLYLLLTLACAAGPGAPEPSPPAPTAQRAAAPPRNAVERTAAAVDHPSVEGHPGQIRFVDMDGKVRVEAVTEENLARAFVDMDDWYEPIAEVRAAGVDGRVLSITTYDVNGGVLEHHSAPRPR
ncbi:MAG: hypothetical protein JXX28_19970 [Deltaproteobacteria bacterium]|nr:hypothetical protein [Deltaproteobacteria bacterium]